MTPSAFVNGQKYTVFIISSTDRDQIAFGVQSWRFYLLRIVVMNLSLSLMFAMKVSDMPYYLISLILVAIGSIVLNRFVFQKGLFIVMKVYVSQDELTSVDMPGYLTSVKWDTISAVEQFDVLWLPYFRVQSDAVSGVIWLPIFLKEYDKFARLVAFYAGPDNPLTIALRERLENAD